MLSPPFQEGKRLEERKSQTKVIERVFEPRSLWMVIAATHSPGDVPAVHLCTVQSM